MNQRIIPLLVTAAFAASAQAAEPQVVVIGHAGPITGPASHLGKATENGVRMALDEQNARNPVIGGKPVRFALMGEDDASDPKQATTIAQKFADASVKAVIGHLNSGTSIPAAKIYHTAGIPQISPAATNPKYTQQGFNTAFRVVANDGQLGGTLGRYAVQILKAQRVAVIDDRTSYGQGIADEFVKGVKSKNVEVELLPRQYTNDKAVDFSPILTAIRARNADVIFYGGMDEVAGPMLRQMKALGITAKLIGGDGVCTDSLKDLAGDAIGEDKVFCAEAGGVAQEDLKGLEDFKSRYQKRFGTTAQMAAYSYDAANLIVAAMKKSNSTEPSRYLPELAKLQYKGVTGPIGFDDKGDLKEGALTLYTYKAGTKTQVAVIR